MTESKITLSAVEYLNTKPFIEGLKSFQIDSRVLITEDTPSQCSDKLKTGRADIGIVPVADFPNLIGFRKITNWGIAANGPVDSVLLVGNQPVERMAKIFLDYQSRTSNKLLRILNDEYFQVHPDYELGYPGYEQGLEDGVGAVIIGDRALKWGGLYRYRYDLAELWKKMTGLPFVFAIWVASKRVDHELERQIDKALGAAMHRKDEIAVHYQAQYAQIDLKHYFKHAIQYALTEQYLEGMDLFLEKVQLLEEFIEEL